MIKYNTANEAIQKIYDYYLSSNYNKSQEFIVFYKLNLYTSRNEIKLNL